MSARRTSHTEIHTPPQPGGGNDASSLVCEVLTWERVFAWASLQWGSVGVSDHLFACPMARYLNAATGLHDAWSVGFFTVMHRTDTSFSLDLPPWAKRVVERIDQGESLRQIDARQFRAILQACKPGARNHEKRSRQ